MSRELKFRAWDKRYNEMHQLQKMSFKTGKVLPYGWNVENEGENFEIMQYTGLKDKNGKDIYKGDIITARTESDAPKVTGNVIFEDGAYLVEYNFPYTLKEFLFVFVAAEYEPIEVIGNIFEHSDLLENKGV